MSTLNEIQSVELGLKWKTDERGDIDGDYSTRNKTDRVLIVMVEEKYEMLRTSMEDLRVNLSEILRDWKSTTGSLLQSIEPEYIAAAINITYKLSSWAAK